MYNQFDLIKIKHYMNCGCESLMLDVLFFPHTHIT